jgi:acyl transferase domain-containing protein
MRALRSEEGLGVLHRALQSGSAQVLVLHGETSRLKYLLDKEQAVLPARTTWKTAESLDIEMLQAKTTQQLKQMFGELTKLPPVRIDEHGEIASYGVDSIMITQLNERLARIFGDISKTLYFEHSTLAKLAQYLVDNYPAACQSWAAQQERSFALPPSGAAPATQPMMEHRTRRRASRTWVGGKAPQHEPIAIIGISGMYPQARTLDEYWENLKSGKNCITEVPPERWPLDEFFDPDAARAVERGRSYCKWGGFLEQFAQFDPLFFGIAPRDALNIDPQERLFLQEAWHALENSGYTRLDLKTRFNGSVGVFAGITKTGYSLHGAAHGPMPRDFHPHTSFSSVANRLSYFLDITGPSMPVDTMCSSSLTAIHEACEHIARGECELAFAGGVNLYLHPMTYVEMSTQHVLSHDGLCHSFGAGANGFVPGEGVGVILLKPLARALEDEDIVHGVILATHVNHGGRTNGYTVPSPRAQADLIRRTIDKAGIHASQISYVEAHGTGTKLGDPIEIEGLHQAFAQDSVPVGSCRIGSAKSNIGHLEAAAGIAGLTKILLQMRHGQVTPSLHAQELNPNIRFEKTPFVVNQTLSPWKPGGGGDRRIASLSSFGAGGANAHLIIAEFVPPVREHSVRSASLGQQEPVMVPLSARDAAQLRDVAQSLREFLLEQSGESARAAGPRITLVDLAYTLQVGREPMEERFGLIVTSMEQLIERLEAYLRGERDLEDSGAGRVDRIADSVVIMGEDEEMRAAVDQWVARRKLGRLLELWVRGLRFDWNRLYGPVKPRRVSLPLYPFAPETYWIERAAGSTNAGGDSSEHRRLACIEEVIERVDNDLIERGEAVELLSGLVFRNTETFDRRRT